MYPGAPDVDPAEFGKTGMEDLDHTDVRIPRLKIQHARGTFLDSLGGREVTELTCVVLGFIKQRIFWDKEVEDGDKPMCKSPDHATGFPMMIGPKPFPWDISSFQPDEFPADESGQIRLPCQDCNLKEWSKDPRNPDKSVPPKCNEQYTFPIVYKSNPTSDYQPAVLTFQKTGISPSRSYVNSFAQRNQPMFANFTTIKLNQNSRGAVSFSVPQFTMGEATPIEMWPTWKEQYELIRNFVRQAPRTENDRKELASYSRPALPSPTPAAPVPAMSTPMPTPSVAAPSTAAASPPSTTPEPAATPSSSSPSFTPDTSIGDLPF